MDIIIAAFVVLFREGFEILLILMTIIRVVQKDNPSASLMPIYGGVAAGVALNVVLGLGIGFFRLHSELADKAVLLTAAALMLYVARGLILFRFTGELKEQRLSARFTGISPVTLFVLTFALIGREGFEFLLFMEALSIQAGGWTAGIFIGNGVAVAALAVIFATLRAIVNRLPVRLIFALSSIYLIVQAGFFIWEAFE
jgi:high-affinity iron transporter